MEKKKFGVPLIALVIFFVLIIGIIITCLIILSNRTDSSEQPYKMSSADNTSNTASNAVTNDIEIPVEEEEDVGTEISLTDSFVISAYSLAGTGSYSTMAKFALYQAESFTETVKLKLAISQLSDDELNAGTVTKARMEECLTEVFGTSDGVSMQTVVMFDDYNFSTEYNIISFDYDSSSEVFTITKSQLEESTDPPIVTEIVNKAISYNSKLEIYVTPLFVQTTDYTLDGVTSKAYSLYSAYDFVNQQFSQNNLLITVYKTDYYNVFVSGDSEDIDKLNKDDIQNNTETDLDSLQQYKYTFNKDDNGNYVLASFEVVTDESTETDASSENVATENTTEEGITE